MRLRHRDVDRTPAWTGGGDGDEGLADTGSV
jgi:hypothetical protein